MTSSQSCRRGADSTLRFGSVLHLDPLKAGIAPTIVVDKTLQTYVCFAAPLLFHHAATWHDLPEVGISYRRVRLHPIIILH